MRKDGETLCRLIGRSILARDGHHPEIRLSGFEDWSMYRPKLRIRFSAFVSRRVLVPFAPGYIWFIPLQTSGSRALHARLETCHYNPLQAVSR